MTTSRQLSLLTIVAGLFASSAWLIHDAVAQPQFEAYFVAVGLMMGILAMIPGGLDKRQDMYTIVDRLLVCVCTIFLAGVLLSWHAAAYTALLFLPSLARAALSWKPWPILTRVANASHTSGIIVALLVLIECVHRVISWYHFDTKLFDVVLYPLLALLGSVGGLHADGFYILDGRSNYVLHFTLEKTHLLWAVWFVTTWVVLYRLHQGIRPTLRQVATVSLMSCFVCCAWILSFFVTWNYAKHAGLSLSQLNRIAVDVLALALLWPFFGALQPTRQGAELLPLKLGHFSLGRGFIGVGLALVSLFCFWYPTGPAKSQRAVLVDDAHSPWEKSELEFSFTDASMTKQAAYSYTNFVDYLRCYYPVEVNSDKSLDEYRLDKFGVLILKTPTRKFSPAEIDAVRKFVRGGGGLFVHGDHTNLFGMSTYLNELLADANVKFNYDDQAAFDGAPSKLKQSGFVSHPCAKRVGGFQFLTSCTLKPSTPMVEPVLVSPQTFSEDARFGRPGFFGNMFLDAKDRAGAFLQAAVVPYGRGRIAAFCDSTVFSNFAVCQSDYLRYAIDTVAYLQHYNPGTRQKVLFAGIAILIAGVVLGIRDVLRRRPLPVFSMLTYDVGLSFLAGVAIAACATDEVYATAIKPPKALSIVLGNATNYDSLSVSALPDTKKLRDYSSFIVACQRAGYFPQIETDIVKAVEYADRVVVINPNQKWTQRELNALDTAIGKEGKRLMVLDSVTNSESTARELLNYFQLDVDADVTEAIAHTLAPIPNLREVDAGVPAAILDLVEYTEVGDFTPVPTVGNVAAVASKLVVRGGQPVYVDADGDTFCARQLMMGGGSVFAYANGENFSAFRLGGGFLRSLDGPQVAGTRAVETLLRDFEAK